MTAHLDSENKEWTNKSKINFWSDQSMVNRREGDMGQKGCKC